MRALKLFSVFHLFTQCLAEDVPSYSNFETTLDDMKKMTYDLGYGRETFEAYVQPNITTFSQNEYENEMEMHHTGHAVRFMNMSNKLVLLYWQGNGNTVAMGRLQPFGVSGTASFPGHHFFVAEENYVEGSDQGILKHFFVDSSGNMDLNYYYDPYFVPGDEKATEMNLMKLNFKDLEKYNIINRNKKFNEEYKKVTGREYLAMYPRQKSNFFMWPADYFGQEHWFTTKETHFQKVPKEDMKRINVKGIKRVLKDDEPRLLSQHRTEDSYLNLTFSVLSCAPKVFEINDFLSEAEVDHIVDIANESNLAESSTGQDGLSTRSEKKTRTRTSYNTWVARDTDQVIDAIYRRAADFMRMDESLFRIRDEGEIPQMKSKASIAEQLQLVHYDVGQEYTAHHDFGYSPAGDKEQGQRFATLLLYLNEPEAGGETEFPRWFNGKTGQGLATVPKKGKAVLFYSQLPDGNMDDLSHHAALPVTKGEKYLINLWVRDPVFDR